MTPKRVKKVRRVVLGKGFFGLYTPSDSERGAYSIGVGKDLLREEDRSRRVYGVANFKIMQTGRLMGKKVRLVAEILE